MIKNMYNMSLYCAKLTVKAHKRKYIVSGSIGMTQNWPITSFNLHCRFI